MTPVQIVHAAQQVDGRWFFGGAFASPLGSDELDAFFSAPRKQGILIVEEVTGVREMVKFGLLLHGFDVWAAASGREAIEMCQQYRENLALALIDVGMEEMDGPQTLACLQKILPDLPCLFMTGGSSLYDDEDLRRRGSLGVLRKPFTVDQLLAALRTVIGLKMPPPAG